MKKMMIVALAGMMAVAGNAKNEKNSNLKPFEGVSLNVPARVRFVYGNEYKVDVQSENHLAASGIRVSVENGVLKIRSIDEDVKNEELFITIESPVEPKLSVGRNMMVQSAGRDQKLASKD